MPVGTPVDVSSWPIALFATTQHFSRFRGKAHINPGQVTDARVSCPLLIDSRLWGEGAPTGAVPDCLFTIRNCLLREIVLDFTFSVVMFRPSRSTLPGAFS